MADLRTRRRVSRSLRAAVCLATVVILGGVGFAGLAIADDTGVRPADPIAGLPVAGQQPTADKRSEDEAAKRAEDKKAARKSEEQAARKGLTNQPPPSDEPPPPTDDALPDGPSTESPAADPPAVDQPVPGPGLPSDIVAGTPCTTSAVVCVSLGAKKTWLFEQGKIVHGPASVSTGGPGKETPVGDFVVEWKHKDHKSGEFFVPRGCKPGDPPKPGQKPCEGAPMNFAVFFAEGGIAFHEGTLNIRSSGCVRLTAAEAEYLYNYLNLGDKVEIRG